MKKFLFLLLALVLSVSVSCSDDKTGDTGGSMLSVTPTEIEFEAAGGSRLLDPAHRCGRVVADAERQYRMVHTGPHIGQNLHVVRGHGDRKRVVETLRDAYLHRPGLRSGRRHRDTERRCLPGFRG